MPHRSKASILLILSFVTTCLASSLYPESSSSLNKFELDTESLSNNDYSLSSLESLVTNESGQRSDDEPFYLTQPLIFSLIIGAVVTIAAFIFFKFWKKRDTRIHHDLDEGEGNLIE